MHFKMNLIYVALLTLALLISGFGASASSDDGNGLFSTSCFRSRDFPSSTYHSASRSLEIKNGTYTYISYYFHGLRCDQKAVAFIESGLFSFAKVGNSTLRALKAYVGRDTEIDPQALSQNGGNIHFKRIKKDIPPVLRDSSGGIMNPIYYKALPESSNLNSIPEIINITPYLLSFRQRTFRLIP
jgi:hypothetical protein